MLHTFSQPNRTYRNHAQHIKPILKQYNIQPYQNLPSRTYQTKPGEINLPNETYQIPNQTYLTLFIIKKNTCLTKQILPNKPYQTKSIKQK